MLYLGSFHLTGVLLEKTRAAPREILEPREAGQAIKSWGQQSRSTAVRSGPPGAPSLEPRAYSASPGSPDMAPASLLCTQAGVLSYPTPWGLGTFRRLEASFLCNARRHLYRA